MRVFEVLAAAACFALSATAAPAASAQTLWLNCQITSSSGVMSSSVFTRDRPHLYFPIGEAVIFQIWGGSDDAGENSWSRWNASEGRNSLSYCRNEWSCDFSPVFFRATQYNGIVRDLITIDRTNGRFSAVRSGDVDAEFLGSASGQCTPTTEPAAPRTQF